MTAPQTSKTKNVCCSWRAAFAVLLTQPPYLLYEVNSCLQRRTVRQKVNLLSTNKFLLIQKLPLIPHLVYLICSIITSCLRNALFFKKQKLLGIEKAFLPKQEYCAVTLGKKQHLSIRSREDLNTLTFNFNWQKA